MIAALDGFTLVCASAKAKKATAIAKINLIISPFLFWGDVSRHRQEINPHFACLLTRLSCYGIRYISRYALRTAPRR